jgi:hypothetical protein
MGQDLPHQIDEARGGGGAAGYPFVDLCLGQYSATTALTGTRKPE